MTLRSVVARLAQQKDLNFLLTNRIPRRLLTRLAGWFSKIELPIVRDLSMATWKLFSDLDLSDARETHFRSMHACFTRRLKDGARPIEADPAVLVSPCDAIVGACGTVREGELLQAKGFPYALQELVCDHSLAAAYRYGCYATLRLTAGMYHRFHAPHDCRVEAVTYVSGDTWNVNPVALRRIEKLFCKNERAVIRTRLARDGHPLTLVPVAAILVASIRLNFLEVRLPEQAGRLIACDAGFRKGEEMGWFEHGSTIIVFAPEGFSLCGTVLEGTLIRMGQPLMRRP
jgi:phosphatidylserine decarboxylase